MPAETSNEPPEPPVPARRSLPTRLVVLAAIALVVVPILISEFPREIARWYSAGSVVALWRGDAAGATSAFQSALAWDPESVELYLMRAALSLGDDLESSLRDCNKALEIDPESVRALQFRGDLYLRMNRPAEAVKDAAKIEELVRRSSLSQLTKGHALNGLAYYRALAKENLKQGLSEVEQALDKIQDEQAMPEFLRKFLRARQRRSAELLDTRGYLHYLLNNYPAARKDLDIAVRVAESSLREILEYGKYNAIDQRTLNTQILSRARNVAVISYHRALVLRKLKEDRLAERDEQRVRDLGFEPNDDLY